MRLCVLLGLGSFRIKADWALGLSGRKDVKVLATSQPDAFRQFSVAKLMPSGSFPWQS